MNGMQLGGARSDRPGAYQEDVTRQRKGDEKVMDLKEKVFPAKPVHFLAVKDGKKEVRVV